MLSFKSFSSNIIIKTIIFCTLVFSFTAEAKKKNPPPKPVATVKPAPAIAAKSAPSWPDIQKQVKDTVVQIIAYSAEFNWLEPYKTPDQSYGFGSGFFINDKGDIVTNYHVVAKTICIEIQIPQFGLERFPVKLIGVDPGRDIALLSLTDEAHEKMGPAMTKTPYLKFGDSDKILRAQEIMTLGFPLGQAGLKSSVGIVSGRERLKDASFIQITAPISHGNSGGPTLDANGLVIGINTCGLNEGQNINYIIPSNEIINSIKNLYTITLLRKPAVGGLFSPATPELAKYLGNPTDGGYYIRKVFKDDFLESIGIQEGDVLYEFNGYRVDFHGDVNIPEREDKVSIYELIDRLTRSEIVTCVIYRKGVRKELTFKFEPRYLPPVRMVYPEFEQDATDYEILGGMVVMPLSLNHLYYLNHNTNLLRYGYKIDTQFEPALIITHVLPDSQAHRSQVLQEGDIIEQVNDIPVKTLADFRQAVLESKQTRFITLRTDDSCFAALSVDKILQEEDSLARIYFYEKSSLIELLSDE